MGNGNYDCETDDLITRSEKLLKLSEALKYRFESERRIRETVYERSAQIISKYGQLKAWLDSNNSRVK